MSRDESSVSVEKVEQLVARCGAGAHLVTDAVFTAEDIRDNHPAAHLAYTTRLELGWAVDWLLQEPLWGGLQDGRAAATTTNECRHCSSAELLEVLYFSCSGSSAEGLSDLVLGVTGTSDFDTMLEFGGPIFWGAGAGAGVGEEPGCISPQSAPQLWAKSTSSPGFVTLHWVPTTQCSHKAPLPALSADSVRQLMEQHCRASYNGEIVPSGPAVNVRKSDATDGGNDFVPCIRGPWWPAMEQFLSRHRVTDFPPAAARRDICRFGVHLVPTGRPGSATQQSEWRVSFSRAEVVAVRHLSARQRATVKAVKAMKSRLKRSGEEVALKSYYIKTAVLWLVQDRPRDHWTGVTDGVHMVLDWLEDHLTAGSLPCFFWRDIDLVAGLEKGDLEDITNTISLMRRQATRLLMAYCDEKWGLDLLLEGGSEPLSERQLRLCLSRELIWYAVLEGTLYRHTAPRWQHWVVSEIPALARLSEHQLLQWRHRRHSGTYEQQCYLLQALSVAPADLVSGVQLTSLSGDMFTWPVTPLLNLLTESDLQHLLGDRAAVATWCHQQLCRPPAERPAGLTAELDTPQGRAEMLLQPELLLRAFSEVVPGGRAKWQGVDQRGVEQWSGNFTPLPTYQSLRQKLEMYLRGDREAYLHHNLPEMDGPTAAATARSWQHRLQHLLSGDRLWAKYITITTRRTDRWQMQQYAVMDNLTEGSTQNDERGAAGSKQLRGSQQEQEEEERCCSYMQKREELELRHRQELKKKERRRRQELQEQEKQHLQERGEQKRRHHQERDGLEQWHHEDLNEQERRRHQELKEQEKQHLQERGEQKRRHCQERDRLECRHRW